MGIIREKLETGDLERSWSQEWKGLENMMDRYHIWKQDSTKQNWWCKKWCKWHSQWIRVKISLAMIKQY